MSDVPAIITVTDEEKYHTMPRTQWAQISTELIRRQLTGESVRLVSIYEDLKIGRKRHDACLDLYGSSAALKDAILAHHYSAKLDLLLEDVLDELQGRLVKANNKELIAICEMILKVKNTAPPAQAQTNVQVNTFDVDKYLAGR
jgi:hypothetical protein